MFKAFTAERAAMPVCEACGQEGAPKRCSRCKEARYCSIACQKQHWKQGHRHKCVKAEKPSVATAAAVAAAAPRPAAAGGAAQGSGGGAGAGHDEECAICLDTLQLPQTLLCGHRFCRGCVASMRQHGVGEEQVCPLCRGPMPDAERPYLDAVGLLVQHERCVRSDAPLTPPLRAQLSKVACLCREAVAIDPEHAEAHCNLGCALGRLGEDGEETAFRDAIAADPQFAMPHFNLGNVLSKRGDVAGAEVAYRACVAVDPQYAKAHICLSIILFERDEWAGAEAAGRAAIAANPQSANAFGLLGYQLQRRGNNPGAIALYAKALRIDPSNAVAKPGMAEALFAMGPELPKEFGLVGTCRALRSRGRHTLVLTSALDDGCCDVCGATVTQGQQIYECTLRWNWWSCKSCHTGNNATADQSAAGD